ncbi:MAG: hypothetical protein Pg6C_20470 [Treponemataceae bacterium]|nr:MAG: hypothetical protein Pg6C_20470 [Treponemataceae bacterium]
MISRSRWNRRNEVIPFFKFSPEIRKAVYTANAVEPVNYTIQKIIKHRQPFPNGGAAVKLIFAGLKKTAQKWTMPVRDWGPPSINSRSFMGKTESPYDGLFTQKSLQVRTASPASPAFGN